MPACRQDDLAPKFRRHWLALAAALPALSGCASAIICREPLQSANGRVVAVGVQSSRVLVIEEDGKTKAFECTPPMALSPDGDLLVAVVGNGRWPDRLLMARRSGEGWAQETVAVSRKDWKEKEELTEMRMNRGRVLLRIEEFGVGSWPFPCRFMEYDTGTKAWAATSKDAWEKAPPGDEPKLSQGILPGQAGEVYNYTTHCGNVFQWRNVYLEPTEMWLITPNCRVLVARDELIPFLSKRAANTRMTVAPGVELMPFRF